jgi:hypothetical protein
LGENSTTVVELNTEQLKKIEEELERVKKEKIKKKQEHLKKLVREREEAIKIEQEKRETHLKKLEHDLQELRMRELQKEKNLKALYQKKLDEETLLTNNFNNLIHKITNRLKEKESDHGEKDDIDLDDNECLICGVNKINAVVSPCGHSNFCHDCITDYKKNFSVKGCPCCRQQIELIIKMFR